MKLKAIKLEKERRLTKHGSYSLALTAVVIAAAVVVNLIVSELPSKYTQIDLTSAQLSVLTEQSEELLDSLTEDITIYYVVQDSNRDTNVSRLLERYAGASGHIKLVEKDPVRYPKFTEQYTDASLTENSVIIECGEQSRVINYEDMYESEFDYEYYSYETTGFDAEGQITSAIAVLSSGNLPKVYMLTGHYVQVPYYLLPEVESTEVSEDLTGSYVLLAAAQGLTVSDDLRDGLTVTNVLSTSDNAYSKTDVQNMKTYAKESGDIDGPFAVGAIASETVELTEELLAEAAEDTGGVSLGTALDELEITDDMADAAEEEAGTEEETGAEEEVGTAEEEVDAEEETGAEEADAAEEVTAAEDTSEGENEAAESSSEGETETAETRVAVFTSSSLLDESANQMVSGGNYRLFVNTVSWLCGNETTVSIPVKNISAEYLTVPAASASFWSIVTIGIIPAGFLLTGLYTWLKRRRQ